MVTPVPVNAGSWYPGAVSSHATSYSEFSGAVLAPSWNDEKEEDGESAPQKVGRPKTKGV